MAAPTTRCTAASSGHRNAPSRRSLKRISAGTTPRSTSGRRALEPGKWPPAPTASPDLSANGAAPAPSLPYPAHLHTASRCRVTREALADRLITYCDALAAFSLVNALAFLVTLGEPDVRCSIAGIATFVSVANLLIALVLSAGLVMLRRFERSLRPAAERDPAVERFWYFAQGLRLTLVWGSALLVVFGVWAGAQDPVCIAEV